MQANISVLSIILCDAVIDDRATNKKTLVGLFNSIGANTCPCAHHKFNVFVTLSGAAGPHRGMLRCINESTGAVLMQIEGPVNILQDACLQDFNFELMGIVFPHFGEYSFEFWCDSQQAASRRCSVVPLKAGSTKDQGTYN